MGKVNIGSSRFTNVVVLDGPGAGGACHEYAIQPVTVGDDPGVFQPSAIHFQNGPIQENGVNGCHQEDLLAIVLHRLQSFQAGDFKCRENALAITKIEEAMHWLNHRTTARQGRGVEGKNII